MDPLMVIYLPFDLPFGTLAITTWPLILCAHSARAAPWAPALLAHEHIHLAQQRRWAICGLGVGLLLWWALYLLVLPLAWNPFRRRWETEAYLLTHTPAQINAILRGAPYWLWW